MSESFSWHCKRGDPHPHEAVMKVTYIELSRKLADLGYTVDRHTYECGERVTVRDGIHIVVSRSADCGDDTSAAEWVAMEFDRAGWPKANRE